MPIFRLDNDDISFPPAELADDDYGGLLAVGGDYSPERLLTAYCNGIFPWPNPEVTDMITWFSPDPRFVLKKEHFHLPASLKRTLKKHPYEITFDKAFPSVIHACATTTRPGQSGTWITDALEKGYCTLHERGFARSAEAWLDGKLVGGLYGVTFGKCFFGESMFAHKPDASKCAFATLAQSLFDNGCPWIDCQVRTDHLARFGAEEISRANYLQMLAEAIGR